MFSTHILIDITLSKVAHFIFIIQFHAWLLNYERLVKLASFKETNDR